MLDKQNAQEARSGHAAGNPAGSEGKRRSVRSGREKGLRIFIPAAQLEAAGIDPAGPEPLYTTQGVRDRPSRGVVLVKLYPG